MFVKYYPDFIHFFKHMLFEGHQRSITAKKNIIFSILMRTIDMILVFITMRLALIYLDPVQFGIFATLTSIIYWFQYLDVGLSHGLRNKFAEALAVKNDELARTYVSTAYFVLTLVVGVLLIIFVLANQFLNWATVLNADQILRGDLKLLAFIVFTAFSLTFIFNLINSIFYGLQKSALVDMLNVISRLLWTVILLILIGYSKNSLLYFGAGNRLVFTVVPLLANLYCFCLVYKKYAPSFAAVRMKFAKELMTLGIKFFVIQISLVVIQATNNLLIAHFAGPASVTSYNIAFKYFSIIIAFFLIVCTPLWSAYTEAYKKGDMDWIKRIISKMVKIWSVTVLIVVVMVFISHFVYLLWIGPSVKIPFLMTVLVGIMVLLNNWICIYHFFINGTSKIRLQMYITLIAALINIPLSIFLVKYTGLGATAVVLGSIVCLSGNAISAPIQAKKIIEGKDRGIWGT